LVQFRSSVLVKILEMIKRLVLTAMNWLISGGRILNQ